MKHLVCLAFVAALAAGGCGDDDDQPSSRSETLIEALTRGVKFENGETEEGGIAKLDPSAAHVELSASSRVLRLAPGAAMIMALDAEADEDDSIVATMLQFEGSKSHIEVPVDDNAEQSDAGRGQSGLHIENPFDVEDDICEHLCNKLYTAKLRFAVQLKGGAVSRVATVDVQLDCRDDGDPDRCDDESGGDEPDASESEPDGGGKVDAGAFDGGMSQTGKDGGVVSPGSDAQTERDAGPAVGSDGSTSSGELAPQIGPISPESAVAGTAVTLTVNGTGFVEGAMVHVDGTAVPTTVTSDTLIEARVPASSTADAGSLAVYVQNVADDPSTISNVLYLQIQPVAGAPVVYDYSPDNGVAGDKILIIASNLAAQNLTILDAAGHRMSPEAIGTISWPTAGTVDTVEVTLPDDITTGPITIANGLGSYKGKIFSVGLNLTRAAGTVLESSSEYNSTNWGRASGGDNLLATSFFTAGGDCATLSSCTMKPWYQITFASAQTIGRIAIRGNREYASGYDFIRGRFEVFGAGGALLWSGDYDLPAPDRDLDITLSDPAENALSVKFSSLEDESTEPGFAELEVFAP